MWYITDIVLYKSPSAIPAGRGVKGGDYEGCGYVRGGDCEGCGTCVCERRRL